MEAPDVIQRTELSLFFISLGVSRKARSECPVFMRSVRFYEAPTPSTRIICYISRGLQIKYGLRADPQEAR